MSLFSSEPKEPSVKQLHQLGLEADGVRASLNPAGEFNPMSEQVNTNIVEFTAGFENEKIDALYHELNGEILTVDGWIKLDDSPPYLNMRGRLEVIRQLRPYFSKNLIFSNFEDYHVNYMLKDLKRVIRKNLISRCKEYDMPGAPNPSIPLIEHIIKMIMDHAKPGPWRAYKAGDRTAIRTMVKISNIKTESQNAEKQKNLFGVG